MLTNVDMFVAYKICGKLPFIQAFHHPGDNGAMVDQYVGGWVQSCASFMYRDYDKLYLLGGTSTAFSREVKYYCEQY